MPNVVQGGREVPTGGILKYFEDRNRAPNAEIGPKDIVEIPSNGWAGFRLPILRPGEWTYIYPNKQEANMEVDDLKKILAGFCIAGLIAGSTFNLSA